MTKAEKKRTIDTLELWISSCESFFNSFKNDFQKRPDALNEFNYRWDRTNWLNEFLEECGFISIDKYLEVSDRLQKLEVKIE